jgi:hypothetical protein
MKGSWWNHHFHGNGKHRARANTNAGESLSLETTHLSPKSAGGFLPERNTSVSLSFDYFHDYYTRGVAIENVRFKFKSKA